MVRMELAECIWWHLGQDQLGTPTLQMSYTMKPPATRSPIALLASVMMASKALAGMVSMEEI
jgi:hypothetical protein